MTTKTLSYYLVVDWKDETIRSRKTAPTNLGPFELCIESEMEIEIPDVDTPSISERLEVPQATVDRIALEEVHDQEFPDWSETADTIMTGLDVGENTGDYEILGRIMDATGGVPDPDRVLQYVKDNRDRFDL